MDLVDVEWGDVLSDDDGVLVVEGTVGDSPVVVKRYRERGHREIHAYALLGRLGVPTLRVLGSGADWLVLEPVDGFEWRLAEAVDVDDPAIARALAGWYDLLHAAGDRLQPEELAALGWQSDAVAGAGLDAVAAAWPELEAGVRWAREQLPSWLAARDRLGHTLNLNGFWYTNLAVGWESSTAMMFDLDTLSAGYRYADLRNVAAGLGQAAGAAFRDEYVRLLALRGMVIDEDEEAVDEPLAHLAALVAASATASEGLPLWAADSYAWLAAHC